MPHQIKHHEGREIPLHDGSKFDWIGANKGLVEASELSRPMAAYLFNDAYDIGFAVHSHKTGRVVVFTLTDEHRSQTQDEVIAWVFTTDTDPQFTISVIND